MARLKLLPRTNTTTNATRRRLY